MDDLWGGLILLFLGVAVAVFVLVYIVFPFVVITLGVGLCYGAYHAIENYASAFKEVVVDGNKE